MPHEQIREENIQRAIEVGMEVLVSEGVYGLQKQIISERTGLSVRSLTRYFKNKENFIVVILTHMCRSDLKRAEVYWEEHRIKEKTGLEQLEIFFDSLRNLYNFQKDRILAVMDVQTYLRNTENKEKVKRQLTDNYSAFSKVIDSCLQTGQRDGSIKVQDRETSVTADAISTAMWGILSQLAFLERLELHSSELNQRLLQEYIDRILNELAI